ncbi:hypothetical protein [Actinoplanes cyaneus]|nr:hypothetical protein [Actinoplanes cyaneus]
MIPINPGNHLNADTWATALNGRPATSLRGKRVLVDLSELEFADFVTLGHLLIFVRAAAAAGAVCTVRLPGADELPDITEPDVRVAHHIVKRHNCRIYLEQAGVVDALGPHVDTGQSDGEPTGSESAPKYNNPDRDPLVTPPTSGRPHRYRRILRYQWLRSEHYRTITLVTRAPDAERTLRELGLPAEVASAVTRGILLELMENAARYSGQSEFLLGGVIVDVPTYRQRADDFDPALADFAGSATEAMIRLVVADTGSGLAAGVTALDERSAGTSGTARARGMWKVARVVSAYQGAILLTSGGSTSGRAYRDGEAFEIAGRTTARLPGLFVECDVLARPSETAMAGAGELSTPRPLLGGSRTDLACLSAPVFSPSGLSEKGRGVIQATLAAEGDVVLAINVPGERQGANDVEIAHAISQVAEVVAATGGDRSATVAFPSVNRPLMAVAVEYLNAESDDRAAAGHALPPPILVLAAGNRHYWAGGTAAQRRVLGRLSGVAGPVSLDVFSPDEVEILNGMAGPVWADGDRVALRTPPRDALTALAAWVGERLAAAIDRPPDEIQPGAVWRGRFLTPSLRETSRWFDLDALLSGLELRALAGVTLAARAEEAGDTATVVLRMPHTPETVAAVVARAVTGGDRYYDSVREIPPATGATRVLLITEVVSTGTTVIGILGELVERGLEPVAVATVVDARPEASRTAHLELSGRRVPLVSLAGVDVSSTDESEKRHPIDPVLRRPEYGSRPRPGQLVRQRAYLNTMNSNAATRLGHIGRPADRHYTAYVDPTVLFRDAGWSETVLDAVVAKVAERHRNTFAGESAKVTVLYPEGTADDLTVIAERLRQELAKAGSRPGLAEVDLDVSETIVPVPRAAYAEHWQLPGSSMALTMGRHAVVIDSGSSSGRTVRHLVGLAADNDVTTITVVLLLNGMSDGDAVNLQRTGTVRRSEIEDGNDRGQATVEVFYVSRTAMSSRKKNNCGVCALRDRYASMSLYAPVPELLEKHREWLVQLLDTRTKQDLFAEQTADLFGANVSQPECVEYLRWRLRLRDAELSTDHRQVVVDLLAVARQDRRLRDPLIRLLVAEPHWLASAPLAFTDCRATVEEMAMAILAGNAALLLEARLRVQAAVLLAQLAPERFARELNQILRVNRDEGLVVPQVLLEVLMLLTAPRTIAPFPRRQVVEQLAKSLEFTLDSLRDQEKAPGIASDYVTLMLIRYLLLHARRPLPEPPDSKQEAWERLRHEIDSAGHDFSDPWWKVRSDIDLAAVGRPGSKPEKIWDNWATCVGYLQRYVLPYLQPLRDILMSKSVLTDMQPEEVSRWEETLSQDGPQAVAKTTARAFDVVEKLTRGLDPGPEQYELLRSDLVWWGRFALDSKAALLNEVISRGPVHILHAVAEFFEPAEIDVSGVPADQRETLQAFCTGRLIEQTFRHIRHNATATHRIPDTQQEFRVDIGYDTARILVTVRNTGSSPESRGGGKGLETLRHRLERFGGSIREAAAEPPWTYAITVDLESWRGPA